MLEEADMKRFFILLLAILMLSGCRKQEVPETLPPTETTVVLVETTVPATEAPTVPTVTEPEPSEPPEPESDEVFVRVLDYIPTAVQELRYATEDNFTGQVIYPFADVYLRYGTVRKLKLVSEDLEELGLYIKIWDGFRPVSAQFTDRKSVV